MSTNPVPVRGRPRRQEVDDRIRRAVLDLIREAGPAAVNVKSVAERSQIARTTIYRRYASRSELLSAALAGVTQQGAPSEALDLEGRIAWVLDRTDQVLGEGLGRGGVAAVLSDQDPEFSAALRHALKAGLEPIREQIEADVRSGLIAPTLDADLVVNLILGAYLAEVLQQGAAPSGWRAAAAAQLAVLLGR